MAQKTPGKAHSEGIPLVESFQMFPTDGVVQARLEEQRWGGEPWCSHRSSFTVQHNNHKSVPWRCAERECRKRFSVRVGTSWQGSPFGYQIWVIHKMSPMHLDRYVQEFAGCHNLREADTLTQMDEVVRGFERKRLTYADLKQSNGLSSGA